MKISQVHAIVKETLGHWFASQGFKPSRQRLEALRHNRVNVEFLSRASLGLLQQAGLLPDMKR